MDSCFSKGHLREVKYNQHYPGLFGWGKLYFNCLHRVIVIYSKPSLEIFKIEGINAKLNENYLVQDLNSGRQAHFLYYATSDSDMKFEEAAQMPVS